MKAVVLNSGGFDSIVLLHYLKKVYEPEAELYSLHFLYGAPNEKMQFICAENCCKELGINSKIVKLPKIDWTQHDFYTGKQFYTNPYLEWRNLIFLGYAASYAESIGAEKIYVAFTNPADNRYPDTNLDFINGLNYFLNLNGIDVDAPFICDANRVTYHWGKYFGITDEDFFSCDSPVNEKPCGNCEKCKKIIDFHESKDYHNGVREI